MTKVNSDIQAVIFVGPGQRLFPIVDNETTSCQTNQSTTSSATQSSSSSVLCNSTSHQPIASKAFVPICNKPLIYYPLNWIIESGIKGLKLKLFKILLIKFCRNFYCRPFKDIRETYKLH